MKTTDPKSELHQAMDLLKDKQAEQFVLLREQFYITYESLKPLNLIKSTFRDLGSDSDVKKDLIGGAIGLATGFLSKKVIMGATHNPITYILGNIIQFAVGSLVSRNSDKIIKSGEHLLHQISKDEVSELNS